jgi:hypothetical protein
MENITKKQYLDAILNKDALLMLKYLKQDGVDIHEEASSIRHILKQRIVKKRIIFFIPPGIKKGLIYESRNHQDAL